MMMSEESNEKRMNEENDTIESFFMKIFEEEKYERECDREFFQLERQAYIETLNELTAQMKEQSNQLSPDAENKLQVLTNELAISQTTISELQNKLSYEISKHEETSGNLIQKYELEQAMEETKAVMNQRDTLSREILMKNEQLEMCKNELDQCKYNEYLQRQTISSLESDVANLETQRMQYKTDFDDMKHERDLMDSLLAQKDQEIKVLVSDYSKKMQAVESELEAFATLRTDASKKGEKLQEQVASLTLQLANATKELESKSQQMQEQTTAWNEQLEQARADQQTQMAAAAEAQVTIRELEEKIQHQRKYMVEKLGDQVPKHKYRTRLNDLTNKC